MHSRPGALAARGSLAQRAALLAAAWLLLSGCGEHTEEAAGHAAARASAKAGRPNIVLFSIDTLRADHVGVYGYPQPTTPRIDAFARDAVRYETCIAQAVSTLASHASIFTSLLPRQHMAAVATRTKLAAGATSLTTLLRQHGYRTASFNGGIQLDASYGLDRDFEVYESASAKSAKAETLAGPEKRTAEAVQRGLAWIDGVDSPFFLFLHSYEIHHPYTPAPEFLAHFESDYDGPIDTQVPVSLLREINERGQALPEADLAQIVRSYDAELRSADAAFGALLDALEARGLYENTLIVLTSDHGEEFGEHGRVGWHSSALYDESVRVPLLIKFAGSPAAHGGRVVSTQVRSIDIAPTLVAALGIDAPASWKGRDLRPGAQKRALEEPLAFSAVEWSKDLFMLRSSRWKLYRDGNFSLFDLATDPAEQVDVASRHPEVTASLRAAAEALAGDEGAKAGTPLPAAPSAEIERQLRELGYLDAEDE